MNLSITKFKKDIHELKMYIDTIEIINSLFTLDISKQEAIDTSFQQLLDSQVHHNSFITKRLFDYKTVVISLYGLSEHFIESLLKEYLDFISKIIPDYTTLPNKIRENHFNLSNNLLKNLNNGKYKNISTEEEIISNLYACIKENKCSLNIEAFTEHKNNFRYETIADFYSKIGIDNVNTRIKREPIFKQYFSNYIAEYDSLQDKIIFSKINQLVDWRNEVAHGAPIDNIISNEMLLDTINFIESYGTALNNVIISDTLPFLASYSAIPLGEAEKVIDNRIICIYLYNAKITIGNKIIAKGPSNDYKLGKVTDLEVNHQKHEIIKSSEKIGVGIEVNFYAKPNMEYYLVLED